MKKIKLSTIVLLAFLAFILGFIAWQCYVTSRVVRDKEILTDKTSAEALHAALQETNSYKTKELPEIKSVVIKGSAAHIKLVKSNYNRAFYSSYYSSKIKINGSQLIIDCASELGNNYNALVCVFLNTEPDSVIMNTSLFCNLSAYGFDGKDTRFNMQDSYTFLFTDTKYLNTHLSNGNLQVFVDNMSGDRIEQMNLKANCKNSQLSLSWDKEKDIRLQHLNADILTDNSYVDLKVPAYTRVGNLKWEGSLSENTYLWFDTCDSLNLNLRSSQKDREFVVYLLNGTQIADQSLELDGVTLTESPVKMEK